MNEQAPTIHFERLGQGPPLLMLHGVPATHSLWRPVAAGAAGTRTVHLPDLPGFGRSGSPADRSEYALPALARTILRALEQRGVDRFDLVGHSYGGALAATIAVTAPERVRSLALLCPMTDLAPPASTVFRSLPGRTILPELWRILPGFVRKIVAGIGTRTNYGAAYRRDRAEEIANELNRPGMVRTIADILGAVDFAGYLRTIETLSTLTEIPLLLIGGRQDRIVPFEHFTRIRSLLPRARTRVFDDGSHMVMWQFPDELRAELEEHWRAAAAISRTVGSPS